uniref:Uncharacterized protein n=1 Tax=Rhizophora mucronata TaxID=61149 RepID=A0A2P2K3J3_RHIMU
MCVCVCEKLAKIANNLSLGKCRCQILNYYPCNQADNNKITSSE